MKHNWEYKRLGDVATYVNGYAFKPSDWLSDGYPIIRIQNLNNSEAPFNFSNGKIPSKYFVDNGDLLISWSASLGAYIWNGDRAVLNQHIFKVIFDKTTIVKNYLKYYVDYLLPLMATRTHGSTMKHITKPIFDKLPIPFPPVEVQERIVAELDAINEGIAELREQVNDLDSLAQTLFYETFGDPISNPKGWPVKKLDDLSISLTDGDHSAPPKSSNGIPFITISNLDKKSYKINFEDTFYVTQNYYNNLKDSRKPRKNDILYSVTGSYGIPILLNNPQPFCFQRHIGLIRPKDSINPIFITYNLRTKSMMEYADNVATGIAQKTVSLKSLKKFPIIVPPLALQEQFAKQIEEIEAMKSELEAQIAEAQTLLDSRMDYWFN